MFKRSTLMTVGLAAAVGIPMLMTSTGNFVDSVTGWVKSLVASSSGGKSASDRGGSPTGVVDSSQPNGPAVVGASSPAAMRTRIEGPAVGNLGDVLRFDVTPGWVLGRWSRVTTLATGGPLEGYRVPLVTGTREDDLAGSLTYHFDQRQQVQRITFVGATGDPAALVALATKRFGFVAEKSDVPGLFLYHIKWNGRATSHLRVRTAQVLRVDVPWSRYSVDLEINAPNRTPQST